VKIDIKMSALSKIVILGLLSSLAEFSLASRSDDNGGVSYQFQYRVKDELTGQDFGQEEERNDYHTEGEYEVMLPDGRRQIVRYKVLDATSGYIANVEYQGDPIYDETPQPAYSQPQPAYSQRQPAYSQPQLAPQREAKTIAHTRPRFQGDVSRPQAPARFQAAGSRRHQSTIQRPFRVNPNISQRGESGRKLVLRKSKKVVQVQPTTPAPEIEVATPAVYIPSRYPATAEYKDLLHSSESKILYSLFREDINEIMKPPKKIPAEGEEHVKRRRRY